MALIDPKKKYKKLITAGCSFTDGYIKGEEGAWGYHLSKLLGCEHINRGTGGSSNKHILYKIIKYCETNDMTDCCVGIQWSERNRREYWLDVEKRYATLNATTISDRFYNLGAIHKDHAEFFNKNQEFFVDIWFNDDENCLRTVEAMIGAIGYLTSKNIDFVMFEGITTILDTEHPIESRFSDDVNDLCLISTEYKNKLLSDKHFFKKYPNMMPFMFDHHLFNHDTNGGHPNVEFVQWWVDELYQYLIESNNE